ncbi:hypothetical protein IDM30_08920 [Acinetobacter seifertii]|nr:hypothetical protein [Acinetobacter seifertii]
MNTQREQLIHTWLTSVLENDQFQIAFLAGDASFRRYARIQLQNKHICLWMRLLKKKTVFHL